MGGKVKISCILPVHIFLRRIVSKKTNWIIISDTNLFIWSNWLDFHVCEHKSLHCTDWFEESKIRQCPPHHSHHSFAFNELTHTHTQRHKCHTILYRNWTIIEPIFFFSCHLFQCTHVQCSLPSKHEYSSATCFRFSAAKNKNRTFFFLIPLLESFFNWQS